MAQRIIPLLKLSGELAPAEWYSTPNLKTEVWQILGIDALSEHEVIGFTFFIRTTLCCRAFTTGCAREPRRARLVRFFVGTPWSIPKDIGSSSPNCTENRRAC